MKKKLILANWKSNKAKSEVKDWLEEISTQNIPEQLEVVIFPPFTLLDTISGYIRVNSLPFKLGAQDVSPFDSGAYTGEVSAKQIKEFADYVLIGHSERRRNFLETEEMINEKIKLATESGLIPIVCISNLEQLKKISSNEQMILAYEPIEAIGTGNAENPDQVHEFIKKVKEKLDVRVIYGGSVNSENIKNYINLDSIEGVLVGGQSLDTNSFISLINNAS